MVKKGGGRALECCTSELPQYRKFEVKFNNETHQNIYQILMTNYSDKQDIIESLNVT